MTQRRFPTSALAIAAALAYAAVFAGWARPLGAQTPCDTVRARARFAAFGYGRPFTRDSAGADVVDGEVAGRGVAGRRRHAVLAGTGGAAVPARGRRVAEVGGGRIAVAKDRPGVRVRKESAARLPVRKDGARTAACPPLVALAGGGGSGAEVAPAPVAESAAGEVLPASPLPGSLARPRGGWLSVPPIFGGLLLGGAAVALGNRPGDRPGNQPSTPALAPEMPVAPGKPATPGTPGTPGTPTAPGTPATPATPGTPASPPVVGGPPAPDVPPAGPPGVTPPGVPATVAPEPSSFALVALGGLAVAARRRR